MTDQNRQPNATGATGLSSTLRRLARSYGVEPSYRDVEGRPTTTPDEALLAVVRSLGAPVDRLDEADGALAARRREIAAAPVGPVAVIWQGEARGVPIRWSMSAEGAFMEPTGRLECSLTLENGDVVEWATRAEDLMWTRRPGDDDLWRRGRLPLAADMPLGYHRLHIRARGVACDTMVICAPLRSHLLSPRNAIAGPGPDALPWGIQAPLYAVRGAADKGMGDLRALTELIGWTAGKGGSLVGLLPVLATFADDPSPYSPASRLFWNEMFLDVAAVSHPAPETLPGGRGDAVAGLAPAVASAAGDPASVDYPAAWAERRRRLEAAAAAVFAAGATELEDLRRFAAQHPTAELYARFRAVCDRHGNDWGAWPAGPRDGHINEADYADDDYRYHLYGQYRCARDWGELAHDAERSGVAIYMDLPLGAPGRSFDAWWRRELFAPGIALGAPPDPFFERGQNWALCPLVAEACRADGYAYLRSVFEHHMDVAGALRIDHVMGMHRQYWIPDGFDATDGAYVRTRSEELWAIMVLESRRHGCALIGEDLGTVPGSVRAAMRRHSVMRTSVLQTDLPAERGAAPPVPPRRSLAALNTHDMPPFAAFWHGDDVDLMTELGRFETGEAEERHRRRAQVRAAAVDFLRSRGYLQESVAQNDPAAAEVSKLATACLEHLAAGPALLVMIGLDDLWGERRQQNVPGTYREHPNWRARSRYAVGELDGVVGLVEAFEKVGAARRRAWLESKEEHR